jgi:hypothetical protein
MSIAGSMLVVRTYGERWAHVERGDVVSGCMELPMSTKTIGRVADVLADVMIAYFVVVSEDVVVGCGRGW